MDQLDKEFGSYNTMASRSLFHQERCDRTYPRRCHMLNDPRTGMRHLGIAVAALAVAISAHDPYRAPVGCARPRALEVPNQ